MKLKAVLALTSCLLALSAQASIVVNGDFSDGLNGWRATDPTEVTVVSGAAKILGDLNYDGGTWLDQTLQVSAGKTYQLSFDAKGDPGSSVYVFFENKYLLPYPVLSDSFQHFTFEVTPTSDSAFLQFSTYGTSATLDNVALSAGPAATPVPEPTTVVAGALLLLPLGASAFRRIRKA